MPVRKYLLSFPERVLRAGLGLSAGVAREVGEIVVPESVRQGQLYRNMVDTTLRFLTEQVGGVERAAGAEALPDNFLARRTAGNAVELLGIVAFRASPVWVLAALADLSGLGRRLIPEITEALVAQGLVEKDSRFESVDELLDGLEKTSSRLASTVNSPPLDVASLRAEWSALREEARGLQPASLPSSDTIGSLWQQLKQEASAQDRSVFETSSMMAVSAVRSVPDGVRWLSATTRVGAARTGQVVAAALLEDYKRTLDEIRRTGYFTYASRQLGPYVYAAARQFSPEHRTLTERLLDKIEQMRR
jgi:hypothetical protein